MKKFRGIGQRIGRIGLISPCSGNLGNAAILSSMISNIRSRIPDAEIIGITLSPEDTRYRHGIESFPITGTSHGMYHLVASQRSLNERGETAHASPYNIKEKLKRVTWLRWAVRISRTVRLELMHIFRSARLVRTLDQVVVTGGGALDDFWGGPWGHPWTLFKFALLSRMYGVPFLFVSVGKCSLEHRLSRGFVGCALRLSQYRSFRDHESHADVIALFPHCSGSVEPDLAYGYRCTDLTRPQNQDSCDKPLVVAVSPIAFCDPRVWPLKDNQRYSQYVDQLVQFLKRTIRDEHRLMLFATDGGDTDTIKDILETLADGSIDTERIQVLPYPPMQTTENLLQTIRGADIVIASRLHAVILSHLIAIPVVAISYDRKVDVHMSEIGQSKYCVNIEEFTSETLIGRMTVLSDAREFESDRLRCAVQRCREQADAQYDLLFGARHASSELDQSADWLLTQVQR